jgi:hypothetical protein
VVTLFKFWAKLFRKLIITLKDVKSIAGIRWNFKFTRSACWNIPGWKFFAQYGTCLCLYYFNRLWIVMISGAGRLINYEEGRKYVWSEVICTSVWTWKWRIVVPCSSLQNELHKRGMCRYASYPWWNERKFSWGRRLYSVRFLNRRTSSHFEHQLWISTFVRVCLFPYQITKLCFLNLSLCVISVFLKRQRLPV